MAVRKVLAMDYGASTGRGIVGNFDGKNISLSEIHRFENIPVFAGATMHWDILRLLNGLKTAIGKSDLEGGVDSLSIDTWGVDFGLLDEYDSLIGNPVHYRDQRTVGISKQSQKYMSLEELYDITGIQMMEINTLFQLLALKEKTPGILNRAKSLLMTPDLLGFFLTGVKGCEYSIASTTELLDARKKDWSEKILSAFCLDKGMFSSIVPSGTVIGTLLDSVKKELSLKSNPKLIAGCGHDTQDAMLCVPADDDDFIFISCGTWALFGTELDAPIIDEKSKAYNISNEGGFGYKTSFLKNIIGTWLIQESRNQWKREGKTYEFFELENMAKEEKPFKCLVNPDDATFSAPGDMPGRIRDFCKNSGQEVPETPGAVVRCINESLALTYKDALSQISDCTGKKYNRIHLLGGGSQSALLCQMTADATGCEVLAGPVEATVIGNIASQLIALGELSSMKEAREIIRNMPDIKTYEPKTTGDWDLAYEKYIKLRR